jgi:hypothetical protein
MLLLVLVVIVLVWWFTPNLVIVSSHWDEDLTWLKSSKYKVVVIDHKGSLPSAIKPTTVIPNRGREASSYIRYIIDNYENLPNYMAFIHGHEFAYHQKLGPILELIEGVSLHRETYVTLNGGHGPCKIWPQLCEEHWPHVFEKWLGPCPELPPCLDTSAQFVVSRHLIRKHPKEMYEDAYTHLMTHKDTYHAGCMYEYMWHFLFGKPWNNCQTTIEADEALIATSFWANER